MNFSSDSQHCIRCGTCCEKGGPAFHREDRFLIDTGRIHTRFLYTIRAGEMVRDDVRGVAGPAPSEIIKIKGRAGTWACVFYDPEKKACAVYDQRPLECRLLKCWDTGDLERAYERDRLTRQDLIGGIAGLWDLVADHEQRCAYRLLQTHIDALGGPRRKDAIAAVIAMVRYDREIRRLVMEKGGIEAGMTDFIFGRPLAETLQPFGYKIALRNGREGLISVD